MIMKTCQKCKIEKSLDGFYKHKQTKDGFETTCKVCKKDAASSWSKDNKDNRIAIVKRYNDRHPERRKETLASYYQENKEHLNARVKLSRSRNKELYAELGRTHANRRRARKLENGFEPYTEKQMIDTYGLLCNICAEPINFIAARKVGARGWERGLHIDHVIPLSKGGADTLENIRPTHGLCNLKKGSVV
jgi:5-methylcytosine-specific restriction endonuclease McrA